MEIPSSFFSIAKDTPVFARVLLRNIKELKDDDDDSINNVNMGVTFLPSSRVLPWDQAERVVETINAMVFKNCVFRSGRTEIDTYVVAENQPIGSSNDGMFMIYKAVWHLTKFLWKPFVALKVADNPDSIVILQEEIRKAMAVRGKNGKVLRIKDHFMDEQSGKLCVVMPYTHGSIRSIMHKNGFSQGFPEDLIMCVLYSVLGALCFLHKQRIFHGDINAGHIYLCNPREPLYYNYSEVTLGYAATVYEDEMGNSMSKWTAAPEIYYGNQPNSEKSDIWLVGITALELAYGGLKVSNRNDLEDMIKEIIGNKKYPDEDKTITEYYMQKLVPFWWLSSSSSAKAETLTEILVQCLAWDPKNRPSADKLLYQPFFEKNYWKNKERDLYNAVMNKNNNS